MKTLLTKCRDCGNMVELEGYTLEGFELRRQGALIQDAFPNMSADHREMLISGTCPVCWDKMFPEEDYDE